jgi:DNA-binding SARP family transcriptional activator
MAQIALLGEVRVAAADGSTRRVGGPRVRLLLALLALEPGRPVRCASLIDAIWGDAPPAEPANALQTLVKRLRAVLPHGVAVESATAGYRLIVDAEDIDVHRFIRLAGEGTARLAAGAAGPAAHALDAALQLWRGPALMDLADLPDLHWNADRWNELRLNAIEARADAYLALGRGRELAASLEHELRGQPLRESLVVRVIRVLAVSGQPTRAHRVFETTRGLLRTELGVPPSSELEHARNEIDRGKYLPALCQARGGQCSGGPSVLSKASEK